MADQDGSGPQAPHEPFQDLQPGDVQIVGRLVEQEDVVAGQQQRGEVDTGRLATRQAGHRLAADVAGQSEGSEDPGGALLNVRTAQGEPALECGGVGVVRSRLLLDQQRRGLVQVLQRAGDAGAPGDEAVNALTRAPLRLLGEVANGGGGRAEPDFA